MVPLALIRRAALCTLAASFVVTADNECDVQATDKVDCHIMNQTGCAAAGCCWRPVSPNPDNLPWCYHKAGTVKTCSLKGDPSEPFSTSDLQEVQRLFEANLNAQGSGMVVASPDHSTPGGDYYFAWMRDGALSMNALLQTAGGLTEDVVEKMDKWVSWVERSYQEDPGGAHMSEPKFLIPSGKPFPGPWCRPQNDGPGLRAITLMAYAKARPSVQQRVWPLVRLELDWVAANYESDGCDLWEEVRSGDFFWNRFTMRMALLQGQNFTRDAGHDIERADKYGGVAAAIGDKLKDHVDQDGYVFESTNRRMDTAVIEAFNVAYMNDEVFAPLSREVVQTMRGLTTYFCNAFEVNQQAAEAGIPGVLYGRYDGDNYAGGNPWVLLTASVATLLYRQSVAFAQGERPGDAARDALAGIVGQEVSASSLLGAGDAILNRMKLFLTDGMHMSEQLDRSTGKLISAKDLTWNYANILKAMKARSEAVTSGRPVADLGSFVLHT